MNKILSCSFFRLFRRGLALTGAVASIIFLAVGCGGPRIKHLTEERLKPLGRDAKVDVYVGEVKVPHKDVAIIESNAYTFVDDGVKLEQLEQLRKWARRLGANSIQNVHILAKKVQGTTIDEKVPFAAWQQGEYKLYFMRGEAICVPESGPSAATPAKLDEVKPKGGWGVERLTPPAPLDISASEAPRSPAQK